MGEVMVVESGEVSCSRELWRCDVNGRELFSGLREEEAL